jgi:hypothetical protein
MGKDREGSFHPPKGKPSGSGKEEGVGLNNPFSGSIEEYQELADKYTSGDSEAPANVKVRHPNRNVNKAEEKKGEKNSNRNRAKTNKSQISNDEQAPPALQELPGVLTKELFENLANYKGEFCVSVYLPTHRSGVEVNELEDSIMFKNVLQEVTSELKNKGADQGRIQRMLESGYELFRNTAFWRNQEQGLAVFIADDYFKFVKMPETPTRELLINTSFMVKPLVNAMTVNEYFYLLVVSKKQAKFFKANAFGMQQIELDELPNGVDDVVHLEEKDDQKLFRTESFHGGKGSAFHGHGAGKPDEKENIAMYLEEVDETLWEEVLSRENVPLLLAGVEYLLPIYKSVSHYRFIWDEVITGSHEHDDPNTLFAEARKVMEPYFQQRTKKALAQYGNQSATALTSSKPEEVIPAAHYARIWHLFVLRESHLWGRFNEQENILDLHSSKQDGDECLIDKAVIKTILNGGDVHFVSREDMPADSSMAALMRY